MTTLQHVPEIVRRHLAPRPVLHLTTTSKLLWIGGPDAGKTTHAKHVALRYPKAAVWDPRGEWKPSYCRRYGWLIARSLEGLEEAARRSSRVALQVAPPTDETNMEAYEEERRGLGNQFSWWCLRNLRDAFIYYDEPHTIFKKNKLPSGMAELLRRGHKPEHNLAMGWSAWGAREMPNDLENVSHVVAFRTVERNDVARIDDYFGDGFSDVVEQLPDYYHLVRQKNPATRVLERQVFPPLRLEA